MMTKVEYEKKKGWKGKKRKVRSDLNSSVESLTFNQGLMKRVAVHFITFQPKTESTECISKKNNKVTSLFIGGRVHA